jgi:ribosomal protein L11 methylase PrmA
MTSRREAASFRDPAGFVFTRNGSVYRQIEADGLEDYRALMASGLYDELVDGHLLVPHEEKPLDRAYSPSARAVIEPVRIPFISYPYEWCFGQLKDAALATLEVQRRAVQRGLVLKDASAFNIQFLDGHPTLVDTLSLARYQEGTPWIAYRQFCQHFLAPLALMSRVDVRAGQLFRSNLDGIPLDLASRLLPARSRLAFSLLVHVHLHAKSLRRFSATSGPSRLSAGKVSRTALEGLIESLKSSVESCRAPSGATQWSGYESEHNYSDEGMRAKERLVSGLLESIRPATVWDLGANTGHFSRLAARAGAHVLALDGDPGAVEILYARLRNEREGRIHPLLMDLANPSPSQGWAHAERRSLTERGPADVVLALALVHHLAITHNVPLPDLAGWLATLGRRLIVEFVPKSDPQSQRLLRSRSDIFSNYHLQGFEDAFAAHFRLLGREPVGSTGRMLYLYEAGEEVERDSSERLGLTGSVVS